MIDTLYNILNFFKRLTQRMTGSVTLGVKALILNSNQEVMLVEHTYMSGWHLPGGGVLAGESPIDAIIREVKEETGLEVIGTPLLFAVYTHQIMGASDYPILYLIKDFRLPREPLVSREIKQAKWYPISALPPQTTQSTRQRLREVLQDLPVKAIW